MGLPASRSAGVAGCEENSWGGVGPGDGDLEGWAVNDVLLWRRPARSLKVLASGSYFLLCLRLGLHGQLQVQPSTVVACSALLFMGAKFALHQYRLQAVRGRPFEEREMLQRQWLQEEHALEAAISRGTQWAFHQAALSVGGLLRWAVICLSGKDPLSTLAAALVLWACIFLGESAVVSQSTLLLFAFLSSFSVPFLVQKYRSALVGLTLAFVRGTAQAWGKFPHKGPVLGAAGTVALAAFMQSGRTYRLLYAFVLLLIGQALVSSGLVLVPGRGRRALRKFVTS